MRIIYLVVLIFLPSIIAAQSLQKSFGYLTAGNYAPAIEAFHKIIHKDQNPAAAFGLAKAFSMKDNPAFNLDSANYYVMKSGAGLKLQWKSGVKKKFARSGYREFTVNELQAAINNDAYRIADDSDTVEGWNHFMNTYTTSPVLDEARQRRNLLAFNEAMRKNDYSSFEDFVKNYPDATQVSEAKALYEKQLYKTKTADSSWKSYQSFMEKNPNSPYFREAKANYEKFLYLDKTNSHRLEDYVAFIHDFPMNAFASMAADSIYSLSTKEHLLDQYVAFISRYPGNKNVNAAWWEIYKMETPEYRYESFRRFAEKYPAFPDKELLQSDLDLSKRIFTPFKQDSLYGYADSSNSKIRIAAKFDDAAPFSEGLAVVQLPCGKDDCPYAYVTMHGEIISNYPWSEANDFHDGLALVAVGNCEKDSCRYGFINRFGEWLIAPQYDDAFEFSDGLSLVKMDSQGYGFINKKGAMVVPLKYPDASPFSEGFASVQSPDSSGLYGFIDEEGKWIIPATYTKAGSFRELLAPAANEKKLWGYIDHGGSWVIQPKFESALPFKNGVAKVVVKSKDRKNPKLFIMKEKMIDKKGKLL